MKITTNLTVTLMALLLAGALSSSTHAATTVASYNAGTPGAPAVAPSPADASWVAGVPTTDVANFQSAGLSPDGASGFNVWRMLDNSAAASQFITWNFAFTAQQHTDAANNGWRMSTRIRAADPVAGNASGNSIVLLYGNNAANTAVPLTVPDAWPVSEQIVLALDGSSAAAHPTDGVTWRDRSGNENHAVSYSAATNTRPTLRTNSLNGLNTVNFLRSAAQALRVEGTNSTGLGSNAYTWFAVSKPTNLAAGVFPSLARHQSSTDGAAWGSYFSPATPAPATAPHPSPMRATPAAAKWRVR